MGPPEPPRPLNVNRGSAALAAAKGPPVFAAVAAAGAKMGPAAGQQHSACGLCDIERHPGSYSTAGLGSDFHMVLPLTLPLSQTLAMQVSPSLGECVSRAIPSHTLRRATAVSINQDHVSKCPLTAAGGTYPLMPWHPQPQYLFWHPAWGEERRNQVRVRSNCWQCVPAHLMPALRAMSAPGTAEGRSDPRTPPPRPPRASRQG